MPPLPSLTPENFNIELDGRAQPSWNDFSEKAAALAGGGVTAEEESLRDLLEDADGMAANAPEEDKESANSLVRAELINVFAIIIVNNASEASKALWPLLLALLRNTSMPILGPQGSETRRAPRCGAP